MTQFVCALSCSSLPTPSMFVPQMAVKTIRPRKSLAAPPALWFVCRHAMFGCEFWVAGSDVFQAIPTPVWERFRTSGTLGRSDLVPPLSSAGSCQLQWLCVMVAAGNVRAHPRRAVLHREGGRCRRRSSRRLLNAFQGGNLVGTVGGFAHVVYERLCRNCCKTRNCVGISLRRLQG